MSSAQVSEQAELVSFLGGVVGLLEFQGDAACISSDTLRKGRIALEALKSQTALKRYKSAFDQSQAWGKDLEKCIDNFQDMDFEQRSAYESSLVEQLTELTTEHSRVHLLVQELKLEKRNIEQTVMNLKKGMVTTMFRPPQVPVRPQPKGLSDGEFDRELAAHEENVRTYPRRFADWKEREKVRQETFEAKLLSNSKQATENNDNLSQSLDSQAKSNGKVAATEYQLSIVQRARVFLSKNGENTASQFKPSNFNLIDFKQEADRLEKCLRELD